MDKGVVLSDLNDLKQRVGYAVEKLARAHDGRRERQDMLFRLLVELEGKFEARREELTYCNSRISDLEKSNKQLSELLETVIQTVETSYVDDASDPIVRAAAMAANLVEQCSDIDDAGKYDEALAGIAGDDRDAAPANIAEQPAEESAGDEKVAINGTGGPIPPVTPRREAPSHHEEVAVEFGETNEDDAAEIPASPPGRSSSANKEIEAGSDMSFEVISAREFEYEERLDREAAQLPPIAVRAANAAKEAGGSDEHRWERKIADALAKVAHSAESLDGEADDADDIQDIPGIENTAEFDVVDVEVKTQIDEEQPAAKEVDDSDPDPDVRALMARLRLAAQKSSRKGDSSKEKAEIPDPRRASGTDDS